jgi:hypothetical protein
VSERCPHYKLPIRFWQPAIRDKVPLCGVRWHVQCFLELTYNVAEEARLKASAAYSYCGLREAPALQEARP